MPPQYLRHTWAISLIGTVYLVAGSLTLLGTVRVILTAGVDLVSATRTLNSPPVLRFGAMIVVMLGLAIYLLLTGWKLRAFRPAARMFAILPLAGLLFAFPIGTLLAGSAILLLLGPGGKFVFSAEYREVASDEPLRPFVRVATWVLAVMIVVTALLVQQYGSLGRALSSCSS